MSETNVQLFPGVFRTTQGGSNPDFFLHSAGRVGIGNDAPGDVVPPGSSSDTFKLNVTGHANVSGTMQANKYYGDGSTLSGVAAVVGGYWDLDQANNNIKYDVGSVGIGGAAGTEKLTVHGDLNLNGGNLKLNGQTAVFSNWTSGTNSIYRSTGNVGIGESNPATVLHISKDYTASGGNSTHFTPQIYISGEGHTSMSQVSAIGFNGNSAADTHKRMIGGGIYYKGGGGNYGLAGYLGLAVANLSSGGSDPYGITEGELESQTRLAIGNNGNVGIGTLSPNTPFEIYTDTGGPSPGGGMRIHHVSGSPMVEFVRGGPNRSPNTNVFGASNYSDWRVGVSGGIYRISRQNTGDSGAGAGNEATVMQIMPTGPILSQLDSGWTLNNTNSGDGDDNAAVSLYRDYSSWISIFKHTWLDGGGGWGTFWAGNSGAAYRRNTNDNNPNEYVLVGGGSKRFTFDLDSGGHAYFDGTLSQNSYDYAEYFEWEDGNPDNEDRRGYSVVLCENGKIKKAISDDEPADIFGIVSGTSGVIGDSACYDWQGKYEVDEWGTIVTDEVYQLTWTDEDNKNHTYDEDRVPEGVTVPDDVSRRLRNRKRIRPEYDASHVYIPRDKRKEWCPVGLVGKVRLRDGCPTNPNWRYMKTVAGKQLWLIR